MKIWKLVILSLLICSPVAMAKVPTPSLKIKSPLADRTVYKSVSGVKFRPIKGGLMDLSHYKGKVLVINFFATWCPPCLKELPDFVMLQKKYESRGLQFIGVAVDGSRNEIIKFAKEKGLNYPQVMGNPDLEPVFGDIQGVPMSFVVDRQLRIVDSWVGYQRPETVELRIRKWL